jgi:hypothetical protein
MKKIFIFCALLCCFSGFDIFAKNNLFNILPKPQEAYYKSSTNSKLKFNKGITVFIKSDSLKNAALYLNELLLEQKIPNLTYKIVNNFDLNGKGIFLGIADNELNDFVNNQNFQKIKINESNPGKEGYLIDINQDIYIINACDKEGLTFAISTFKQLFETVDNGSGFDNYIQNARIIDVPDLSVRWLYYPMNFLVDANSTTAKKLFKNCSDLKFNGVLISDYKFDFCSEMPKKYFDSIASVRKFTEFYNFKIAQGCMNWGYSNSALYFNTNFAEGLPVLNQKFIVESDSVRLIPSAKVTLPNGGFENYSGNNPSGYSFIDRPGQTSFIDTDVKHSGNASLRFEKIYEADPANATARICARIIADKFKMYHISGWIKTDNFTPTNSLGINVLSQTTKRSYQFANINVPSTTNGWQRVDVNFNSLDADTLLVYWAIRGCKTGTIWWDDINVEEYYFTNMIRRNTAPASIVNKSGGGIGLIENVDCDSLYDSKTGKVNGYGGDFDIFHQAPKFKIRPTSSKVRNGDTLLISYHNAITVYDGQVMASPNEPDLKTQIENQFKLVNNALKPDSYFMSDDEIRVLNWETMEKFKYESPAEILAKNANWGYDMIRKYNPKAKIFDWSDMFDELHNAVKGPYYLVNGDMTGSADLLNKDITIANWNTGSNFTTAPKSLKFFEDKGFKQIAAPFYDSDQNHIRKWKEVGRDFKGFLGMMYTTWARNFNYITHFAEYSWNHPPYLSHTPLMSDTIPDNISFKIDALNDKWDTGSLVKGIKLFYKFSNQNKFDSLTFAGNIIDSTITFNLKKQSDYLEYFIIGLDSRGWSKRLPIDNQNYYKAGKSINSVNEINSIFSISPNPASDYIEISLSPAGGCRGWTLSSDVIPAKAGIYVEIFNIFGELQELPRPSGTPSKEGEVRLDISNLASGVYFIKIGDRFEKFVKF